MIYDVWQGAIAAQGAMLTVEQAGDFLGWITGIVHGPTGNRWL
jgi:hypothetical protein